jgi:LemA protein
MWWIILIGAIAVIVLYIIIAYNSLIVLRNRINNAESQIDVQLKRRTDLIPNLVETVKGYAKHEKGIFENVSKARSALMKAQGMQAKAKANQMVDSALGRLFAVAENYPQLRANENFMMLQEELSGTEGKIAYARQFFNDTVLKYNNAIQLFPKNIIANMFNFGQREFFDIEESEKKPVKVSF